MGQSSGRTLHWTTCSTWIHAKSEWFRMGSQTAVIIVATRWDLHNIKTIFYFLLQEHVTEMHTELCNAQAVAPIHCCDEGLVSSFVLQSENCWQIPGRGLTWGADVSCSAQDSAAAIPDLLKDWFLSGLRKEALVSHWSSQCCVEGDDRQPTALSSSVASQPLHHFRMPWDDHAF
jgi:hypothetical protein